MTRVPTVRATLSVAGTLVLLALVAVTVRLDLPVAIRTIVALPLSVGLGGDAAVRLLLTAGRVRARRARPASVGPITGSDPGPDRVPLPAPLADPALRGGLTVVLGLLVLLTAVLGLGAAGIDLDAGSLVIAATGLAAALTLAAALVAPGDVPFARPSGDRHPGPRGAANRRLARGLGAGLAAAVLLVAAVGVARSFRPQPAQPFTMLAFTTSGSFEQDPVTATVGARVTLPIALRGYDSELPTGTPELALTVGSSSPTGLRVRWLAVQQGDPFGTGAQSERPGTLVFTAPERVGLYHVRVETPDPRGGGPLLLTTDLRVTR